MQKDSYKSQNIPDKQGAAGKGRSLAVQAEYHQTSRYLSKKVQRLTAAIHMVTSFMSESEPIRQTLRQLSLDLLKDISAYAGGGDWDIPADALVMRIRRIASFLDVARETGYISDMNHTVLVREYEQVVQTIYDRADSLGVDLQFPAEFFSVPEFPPTTSRLPSEEKPPVVKPYSGVPRGGAGKRKERISRSPQPAPRSFAKRHAVRRESIVAVVRERGRVSVKDVAAMITDCSEKTLQRELLGLVAEGTLRREGKRRWSVYFLAR